MQTRGVFPELTAPFTTPATPPVEPPLSALQQALVDKDAEIARLQGVIDDLQRKNALLQVSIVQTLKDRSTA